MFKCDKCGLCCENLNLNPLYADLDSGDGSCIYYDKNSHLCSIYDHRPVKCNIDRAYNEWFADKLSREEYYRLNYEVCEKLKN